MQLAFVLNYGVKSKEIESNLRNKRFHVKLIIPMASLGKIKPAITPFSATLFSVREMIRFSTAPMRTVWHSKYYFHTIRLSVFHFARFLHALKFASCDVPFFFNFFFFLNKRGNFLCFLSENIQTPQLTQFAGGKILCQVIFPEIGPTFQFATKCDKS